MCLVAVIPTCARAGKDTVGFVGSTVPRGACCGGLNGRHRQRRKFGPRAGAQREASGRPPGRGGWDDR